MDAYLQSGGSGGGGGMDFSTLQSPATSVPSAPANPAASNVGKFTIDLTNPLGSVMEDVGSAAGLVGGLPVIGPLAQAGAGLLGGIATGAANVAGGVGDIGVGGFGVKQAVGVAGEGISGPGRWIQTQTAGARIAQATGKEGPGGIGGFVGGAINSFLNGPAGSNQKLELPADLQLQLDQGVPVEKVANQLADRNAGFESDPLWNTLDSVVFDPVNFIGAGLGKLVSSGQQANAAIQIERAGGQIADVNSGQRIAASMYNTVAVGLDRAASASTSRLLGPITTGVVKYFGSTYNDTLSAFRALDSVSANRISEALGIAQGNHGLQVVNNLTTKAFRKGIAVMADDPVKGDAELTQLRISQRLSNKSLQSGIEQLLERTMPDAVGTPEELATQAAAMYEKVGVSPDIAAQIVGKTATVKEWQLAYEAQYGAAIKDGTAAIASTLGRPVTDAAGASIDASRLTLVNPEHAQQIQQIPQDISNLEAAKAGKAITSIREANAPGAKAAEDASVEWLGTPSVVEAPTVAATADNAKTIMADILSHNPDAAAAFEGKTPTAAQLLAFLRKQYETLPEIVKWPAEGATGINKLPTALQAFREKWGQLGYQLGFAPKDLYVTAHVDGETVLIRPWTPLVSDSIALAQRNPIGQAYDSLFNGISQGQIVATAANRLVAGTAKYGISRDEARAIMDDVLSAAHEINKTPRAAYAKFDSIFSNIIGPQRLAVLENAGTNPTYLINQAFEGDWKMVGLTQKATGILKTAASGTGPLSLGGLAYNWPVKLAEKIYPMVKFEYNPMFFAQQLVENPTYNLLRGISKENLTPEMQRLVDALVTKNAGARYVLEAGWETQMSAYLGAGAAFGEGSRLGNLVNKAFPGLKEGGLPAYGKQFMIRQISHDLPNEVKDAVMQVSPAAWGHWVEKVGDDPQKIVQAILTERFNLAEGQKGLNYELNAIRAAGKLPTAEDQTVWNAVEYALRKTSDQAYKTHFFNPTRGFLERTLNHPYLGLYPLSYMWGKVVPEFARFLFLKPFGRNAPLTGYAAMNHIQQAITVQMSDPEFAKNINQYADSIYLIQLLLPATFTDIPVNAPAWARHLSASTQGGATFNLGTEVANDTGRIGALNFVPTMQRGLAPIFEPAVGSLQDQLTNAANSVTSMLDMTGQ